MDGTLDAGCRNCLKLLAINLTFLRQNKVSLLIASLVILGLLLAGASKIYTSNKTKQAGKITQEAASTSKATEEAEAKKPATPSATKASKSETFNYVVKEGDYVEKIIADVCGQAGGKILTSLRNKDRILVGQTLEIQCN